MLNICPKYLLIQSSQQNQIRAPYSATCKIKQNITLNQANQLQPKNGIIMRNESMMHKLI